MSRIHEALQKAYRERMSLPPSKLNGFHEPITATVLEEPPPLVTPGIGLEKYCSASVETSHSFPSYARRSRRRRRTVSQPSLAHLPGSL